jgi:hypothetical protein
VLILRIVKLFQGKNHLGDHKRGMGRAKEIIIVVHNEGNFLEF